MKIKTYYYVLKDNNSMELETKIYNNVKSISENNDVFNIVTSEDLIILGTSTTKLEIL